MAEKEDAKYSTLITIMGFTREHGERWTEDVRKATDMRYYHDGLEYLIRKYGNDPRELAMVAYGFGVAVTNTTWLEAAEETRNRVMMQKLMAKILHDTGVDPADVVMIQVTSQNEDQDTEKHR